MLPRPFKPFSVIFVVLPLTSALWPQSCHLQTGPPSSVLCLAPSNSFTISVDEVPNAPEDLIAAAQRTHAQLFSDDLGRLVLGRGIDDLEAISDGAPSLRRLVLRLDDHHTDTTTNTNTGGSTGTLGSTVDDGILVVPADGSHAVLKANSTIGLFRGLNIFSQLWLTIQGTIYPIGALVEIQDSPAYVHDISHIGGFMLDTARNFFPVCDIERTLDAMSWINTFHWHVVDSQSFPLVVPEFTDIAEKAAYSADAVYTPQDVAHIVSYAGQRGIDVLVEIDTPGHTSAISKAYPEHVACADAKPWRMYANEPPAGQLRLASPATIDFTASLLSAAAKLFPSTLFATGGDGINTRCYQDDPQTQQDLAGRTLNEALDVFTQATHGALRSLGKTPVVSEEMVLNFNLTLSNDTIALVWISSEDAAAVAAKGFRFIHAASNSFYLDCGAGGWVGDYPPGNSWCEPFKTWQNAYTFDPLANLTSEQASLVLGGQHLLWTEQSGPENLDSIAWPRAAASAEVFWTGPGGNDSAALPRLHELGYRFRRRGVKAISLQHEWCALRPFACDLNA
ncbi:N-acetylhexosaminidase [Lactifluus volemus]|nr:N-acetylhexosaminidase [Lactifluus volemus]